MAHTDNVDARTGPAPVPSDAERRRRILAMATAAAVVIVGASALVASRGMAYWTPLGPGPAFFPTWLGGLLAVFGALWLVQLVRGTAATPTVEQDAATTVGAGPAMDVEGGVVPVEEQVPDYSLSTVVAIVVSICVLAAVLETLGYQLSMLLFLLFHLLVLGRRRLLLSAVIAVAGSFGVFVIFTRFLTVPLPASSIPFLRDLGL
jgi:putative tricarboxylic transport membrane protein